MTIFSKSDVIGRMCACAVGYRTMNVQHCNTHRDCNMSNTTEAHWGHPLPSKIGNYPLPIIRLSKMTFPKMTFSQNDATDEHARARETAKRASRPEVLVLLQVYNIPRIALCY